MFGLLKLALLGGSSGDVTPGGATDVILLENGDGLLLEDGTSFFTLE
jgi:hypothetical protein